MISDVLGSAGLNVDLHLSLHWLNGFREAANMVGARIHSAVNQPGTNTSASISCMNVGRLFNLFPQASVSSRAQWGK